MNPSNILCWNVRGLNSKARQDSIRTLINSSRVDVICIQETKMAAIPRGIILSMLGSDFSHYAELPSIGASGGIFLAWRQSIGPAAAVRVDSHCIFVQFCMVNHGGLPECMDPKGMITR